MKLRILSILNTFLTRRNIVLGLIFIALFGLMQTSCTKNTVATSANNIKLGSRVAAVPFTLDSLAGNVNITYSGDTASVVVTVQSPLNVSALISELARPGGVTLKLPSGLNLNFKGSRNSNTFTVSVGSVVQRTVRFQGGNNPYTFVATSSSGTQQTWIVKIQVVPPAIYIDPQITQFFNRQTGWIASDGGYSIPLNNGKVLWVFGDSYSNDYDPTTGTTPCLFNNRSIAMLQPYNNWQWQQTTTLLNSQTGTLFRSNPANNYFNWPAAGIQIGDTVYVYCLNEMNVSGGLGFGSGGNDVFAKMRLSDMSVVGYHSLQDFNGISFGLGIVKNDADGYVYIYGNKQTFIASNVFVARFPISNPNSNWTFWDGTTWNTDITQIAPVANCPSTSVEMAKVKDKYLLFTSEFSLGCDGGTHIYASVSSSLTGPFSANMAIYKITDTLQGHYPFFYLPIPHPEYINAQDELLLTYSINGYGTCVPSCVNNRYNPNYYRPRGIRVPLKLIDPKL